MKLVIGEKTYTWSKKKALNNLSSLVSFVLFSGVLFMGAAAFMGVKLF
jgi:hypothetical protein